MFNLEIFFEDYFIVWNDRDIYGGGVLLVIKLSLFKLVREIFIEIDIEICFVEVIICCNINICLCCCYRLFNFDGIWLEKLNLMFF